jgi:hypothetical protein
MKRRQRDRNELKRGRKRRDEKRGKDKDKIER